MDVKVLYRVEMSYGEPKVFEFRVVRETDCFYFVRDTRSWRPYATKSRRVSKDNSPFARTTVDSAWNSFYHRKLRHIRILKGNLEEAQKALRFVKTKLGITTKGGYYEE